MTERIDQIRSLLEKSPQDIFLHYSLGMELAKAEKFDQAVEAFRQCDEVQPGYLPAMVEAAKCLRAAGKRDEAREAFTAALQAAEAAGDQHVGDFVRSQLEGLG